MAGAILIQHETSLLFSSDPLVGAESVSADGSSFSTTFDTPFVVPASAMSCSAGVIAASVWNTTPNIGAVYGNNLLSFVTSSPGAPGPHVLNFEQGLYSLDALNASIGIKLQNLNLPPDLIQLSPSNATQRVILTLSLAGDQVLIGAAGSVGTILGWPLGSAPIVAPIAGYSETAPVEAALNRTNSYLVTSDFLTTGLAINGGNRGLLAQIPIDRGPGSQINYRPAQVQWFPAGELIGNPRQSIRLSLTNQDFEPTPTSGDTWSLVLVVKWSTLLTNMSVPLRAV